jgi:hypothetical protein
LLARASTLRKIKCHGSERIARAFELALKKAWLSGQHG